MRIFPFLITLLVGVASVAGAETVNRVAAVVNEDIVTVYQVEKELQARLGAGEIPPGAKDEARRLILEQLIEDTLIRQRIEELGIKVSDEEIEAAIQDVLKQNKLSRDQLQEALSQQGMGFSEYKETLRRQILQFKLVGREVQSQAEVTTQEIREYFREHIDEYREAASVRLNRLTVAIPRLASGEQIAEARRKAEEALARLRQGEQFASVLLAYVADRSAEGGDMGSFAPGEMTAVFERAVNGLAEGEFSDVVETPQGFHILQVSERNPGRIRQYDAVKDEIARILREHKTEARAKEWREELKKKATIEIKT